MKEVSRDSLAKKTHLTLQSKTKVSFFSEWTGRRMVETALGKANLNIEKYYCVPF